LLPFQSRAVLVSSYPSLAFLPSFACPVAYVLFCCQLKGSAFGHRLTGVMQTIHCFSSHVVVFSLGFFPLYLSMSVSSLEI
jgi:hypothetical protein